MRRYESCVPGNRRNPETARKPETGNPAKQVRGDVDRMPRPADRKAVEGEIEAEGVHGHEARAGVGRPDVLRLQRADAVVFEDAVDVVVVEGIAERVGVAARDDQDHQRNCHPVSSWDCNHHKG